MSTLTELFDSISKKIHDNKKLDYYIPLVNEYIGTDWKKYVSFSDIKYKKNLVKRNENLEMLIICWNNNQTSGIHDHPPNGCILKILDGELEENEYINNNKMELVNKNICKKNSVGYQEGKDGLHDIINKDIKTVSLHIYSPPNYKLTFY